MYYLPWKEEQTARRFSRYNHEQQAEIVARYFDIHILKTDGTDHKLVEYINSAMSEFIKNPREKTLLPCNAKRES